MDERRYLTDDRDQPDRHELIVTMGENGDWYVQVLPQGHRMGPAVRICTSGAAACAQPGLPSAIANVWRALASEEEDRSDHELLEKTTPREREVLLELARGRSNREIARSFNVSTKTVDTHRGNLLRKLSMRGNVDLARFAIRIGWITP